jgi:hypothetical protein
MNKCPLCAGCSCGDSPEEDIRLALFEAQAQKTCNQCSCSCLCGGALMISEAIKAADILSDKLYILENFLDDATEEEE